jgi:nucleoside-diphosphate-sugar epimerase
VLVITGSSGFIGSHLCRLFQGLGEGFAGLDIVQPDCSPAYQHIFADIRSRSDLRQIRQKFRPTTVIHLAARSEVSTPLSAIDEVLKVNVEGTLNIVEELDPDKIIFASSCTIYGNTGRRGVGPAWNNVKPVGIYGMSKAAGELICRDWAREKGRVAVTLRFGNVVGEGCRGLIPYLVRHAVCHRDQAVSAQMRGEGEILRDYVPVSFVAEMMKVIAQRQWPSGAFAAFNLGTGESTTNGYVAAMVQRILRSRGYPLQIDFSNPLMAGEAQAAVLNITGTELTFKVKRPKQREALQIIRESTLYWLDKARSELSMNEISRPGQGETHSVPSAPAAWAATLSG